MKVEPPAMRPSPYPPPPAVSADADAPVRWIDLIAMASERHSVRPDHAQRQMKLRQVHDALRRLSRPEVQLVELPNLRRRPTGKYEGFLLMHEGGAPAGGGNQQ